jgi:hypothetical protein
MGPGMCSMKALRSTPALTSNSPRPRSRSSRTRAEPTQGPPPAARFAAVDGFLQSKTASY